ncbi:hypothetical protein HAX54_049382 [Datura stramonium]|uniref:F-box domain-containing protein n=1 Tax=Datura stramonium TaxID=4076 RepID=A0ABS8SUU2_DATST|nr:hypothetical protein [Datura stramonium]
MDKLTNDQNSQSDEAPLRYGFDCLPEEVVVDIASRLPITSLLQFTFVRKLFYNLSRDPELVNLHLSRAVKNDPCIIIYSGDQLYFLEFSDHGIMEQEAVRKISTPFIDSLPEFEVVGSCYGLLCLHDTLLGESLYVYNPFTRSYKVLPTYVEHFVQGVMFGFGFHPITKEYKLIKILVPYPNQNCISVIEVLTLGSNIWRYVCEMPFEIDPSSEGIMLNGKMHWFTQFAKYNGRCDRLIVSFDFADEVFGEEFIIGTYNTPNPNCLLPHIPPLGKVLCLLKNGELLLEYLCGNLVLYDPQNGVFRTLSLPRMRGLFQTILHVGCLKCV